MNNTELMVITALAITWAILPYIKKILKLRIIKTRTGIALAEVYGVQFNKGLEPFNNNEIYEKEVQPIVTALQEKLCEHKISGIFTACTENTTIPEGNKARTRGFCAFFGPKRTMDEQMVAMMYLQNGMHVGVATTLGVIAHSTDERVSEDQMWPIVDGIGKEGMKAMQKTHQIAIAKHLHKK